jgi:hypothetical protein
MGRGDEKRNPRVDNRAKSRYRTPALLDGAAVLPVRCHRDAPTGLSGRAVFAGTVAAFGMAGRRPDPRHDGNSVLDIVEDRIRMEQPETDASSGISYAFLELENLLLSLRMVAPAIVVILASPVGRMLAG